MSGHRASASFSTFEVTAAANSSGQPVAIFDQLTGGRLP